uniref:BTB domain-containing protein n=1 Tax=Clastoptera arizonana TaxID=38151 RepID=A0A1B6C3X6_9HEMI
MGQYVGKLFNNYPRTIAGVYNRVGHKRKRIDLEDDKELEKSFHHPKKVKLACTTKYIYKALFLDGGDYDICVDILGKEWKLHKIYLQQAPYFASMFSGSWKESNKSHITIEVVDPNITIESLDIVLGSLYFDEPSILPSNVVNILAAATLFQMEGIIEQSINLMIENMSPLTAVIYYDASRQYGIQRVNDAAKEWFSLNLLTFYPDHPQELKFLDQDLMMELVADNNLVVIPTEFALYCLLKVWLFMKLNPEWVYRDDSDLTSIDQFYKNRTEKGPLLLTLDGRKFMKVFKCLRINNLLLNLEDLKLLIADFIIPRSWIYPKVLSHYETMLKICSSCDKGPALELTTKEFLNSSLRCGRIITSSNNSHSWHWNLFNFGLHLIWTVSKNSVTVHRIRKTNDYLNIDDNKARNILVRVRVINLNKLKQIQHHSCSEVTSVPLVQNSEVKVLILKKEIEYPVLVSVNLLFFTPEHKSINFKAESLFE